MAKIFVVAGNMYEPKEWARKYLIPIKDVVYVSSPNVLRGISDPIVAYVGTYASRKDLIEIANIVRLARAIKK